MGRLGTYDGALKKHCEHWTIQCEGSGRACRLIRPTKKKFAAFSEVRHVGNVCASIAMRAKTRLLP